MRAPATPLAGEDAAGWVAIRWPVRLAASVEELGTCPLDVTIVDLSVSGCRMWAGFRLTPHRAARLRIAGLAPIRGCVAWSREWYAAIAFDTPLHPAIVRHLVAGHRPNPDVDATPDAYATRSA